MPLDGGDLNVVEVNNEVKRSAQIPVAVQQSAIHAPVFPAATTPLVSR